MSERLADEEIEQLMEIAQATGLDGSNSMTVLNELLALRAENERLQRSLYVEKRGWTAEQIRIAEADALRAENERLREALTDAIECTEHWAVYASDYFKEKHDYAGDVVRLRAALSIPASGAEEKAK